VLDFDGVMTDNKVIADENGKESVVCNRSDSLGIEMLKKKLDFRVVVISKERNKVVAARCKKLGVECIYGSDDKMKDLKREVEKSNIRSKEVCFVGNDVNDLECISHAGVGVAVADSHPSVLKAAKLITTKRGGNGAVREVCDWILESRKCK